MKFTELCSVQSRHQASANPVASRGEVVGRLVLEHQLDAMEYDTELRWVDRPGSASSPALQVEAYRELEGWLAQIVAEEGEHPFQGWTRAAFQS
jgi:hypothetical protein